MEYTYEFLRKCHGLRFKATINNKPQEGIIKVMSDCIMFCLGDEDYGRLFTFERRDTLSLSAESFRLLPSDFEIVPRDPETYKDWQVGDVMTRDESKFVIIFRCGEVIVYRHWGSNSASTPHTCDEIFDRGYRLVLTDVEKQILEKKPVVDVASTPHKLTKFESVLVRDKVNQNWIGDIYLQPGNMTFPYGCINGMWKFCIPLNENTEHLLDTDESCNLYAITQ